MQAFEGMTAAADTRAADWAASQMRDRHGVALVVPAGFPAVVRIMHRLTELDESKPEDPQDRPVRWADVLPGYLRTGPTTYLDEQVAPYNTHDGTLTRDYLGALLPVLTAATRTPESSWYAVWKGFGEINTPTVDPFTVVEQGASVSRERLDRIRRRRRDEAEQAQRPAYEFIQSCAEVFWWGGRDMALMSGPLTAVYALGGPAPFSAEVSEVGPQMWWPSDRAWFVGNEIDDAWTYLAGPRELVDAVLALAADGAFEAYEVSFEDRW